jgi:hypothetical protein
MFLIMSADYVGKELESEFGRIPPSFLPLGNRRLFQHQVKLIPSGAEAFISVPESFELSETDNNWLLKNNVTVLKLPDKLSLGASVVAALNLSENSLDSPLHILFGDTLIEQLPSGDDIVGISEVHDSYDWAIVTNDDMHWLEDSDNNLNINSCNVVNGYFKFSKPRQVVKAITQSHWGFLDGLNRYHNDVGLSAAETKGWLDFGHVNTYYRSKATFTTQRSFNNLTITPDWVEKSSSNDLKIKGEANWFNTLPLNLRMYTPHYLGSKDLEGLFSYRLEYLHYTSLNELYVFAETPNIIWKQILSGCIKFIKDCRKHPAPEGGPSNGFSSLFCVKTEERLNEYCQSKGISLHKKWNFNDESTVSLSDLFHFSKQHLPTTKIAETLLHGDFCFSNILYDFRTGRIKTIDPRGLTIENEITPFGDTRYDLAKLSHSILGMYDWIVAGYCHVEVGENNISFNISGIHKHKQTQQDFIELIGDNFGLTPANLYAMQIQLFISMLPLHNDDSKRQNALFANAFRLYQILRRFEE